MSDFLDFKEGGVYSGPVGSNIRDKHGVDNTNPGEVYSQHGLRMVQTVMGQFHDAGAGRVIGMTPTFRLTDTRANMGNHPEQNWVFRPGETFELTPATLARNKTGVDITRALFGEKYAASIAPISDTSGGDDERWKNLGTNQMPWAMQRQKPQIEALYRADARTLWVEACRYVEEALAIVLIAKKLGFERLVISFEANENGFPDPGAQSILFKEIKRILQREAGDMKIYIGANCTGIDNIRKIWMREDHVDVAYPNDLNFPDDETCRDFGRLMENREPSQEDLKKIEEMKLRYKTDVDTLVSFFRDAYQDHGVLIAGGCCGTTHNHTRVARWAFDEAKANGGR